MAATLSGSGSMVSKVSYDAFGNVTLASGTGVNGPPVLGGEFGFHGGWRDASTGLYHLGARSYDPTTGRFTSRDPVQGVDQMPETFNAYAYGHNNPMLYPDLSGMFSIAAINLSTSIQTGMQVGKQSLINKVRQEIKDTVVQLAGDLAMKAFLQLLPGGQSFAFLDSIGDAAAQGKSFEKFLRRGLASSLQKAKFTNLVDKLLFEVMVNKDSGKPESDGFNSGELLALDAGNVKLTNTHPRPDVLFKDTRPTDDSNKAWIIGDIKRGLINAWEDMRDSENQWIAMSKHAQNYQKIPVVSYLSLYGTSDAIVKKMHQKAIGSGVVLLLVNVLSRSCR